MLWFWNFFLEKKQFSYVLIRTLVLLGVYALFQMPKENFPPIVIPDGMVVTALPGASAADIETLVTDKIEDQIANLSNIDTVTSNSSDGVSVITAQFNANADINQSIQDLRDAVSKAVPELPTDATAPQVNKIDFTNQPILVASVTGELQPTEFQKLGKTLSDDLKKVAGVSTVTVTGVPNREVDVVVRKESLDQYGLKLPTLFRRYSRVMPLYQQVVFR